MGKLHLHVKEVYFRAMKSGEKTEEYREHTAYWLKRLVNLPSGEKKVFDGLVIHNGYKPGDENRIEFPWRSWTLKGITHPHFGKETVTVFEFALAEEIVCPKCGNGRQVWHNQRTGVMMCHRATCGNLPIVATGGGK